MVLALRTPLDRMCQRTGLNRLIKFCSFSSKVQVNKEVSSLGGASAAALKIKKNVSSAPELEHHQRDEIRIIKKEVLSTRSIAPPQEVQQLINLNEEPTSSSFSGATSHDYKKKKYLYFGSTIIPSGDTMSSCAALWSQLSAQDDVATSKVIQMLLQDATFCKISEAEQTDIISRDEQDAQALRAGITFAQDKGVLPKIEPAPYAKINVLGKSADEVADCIIKDLGEGATKGCVLVLVGLSGTGKGTTVSKLQSKLSSAVTWSNGNVFRCLTVQACDFAESKGLANFEEGLTAENLASWMEKIKFGKFNGKWDIQLTRPDGSQVYVSEVANTLLKEPRIGKNIPAVAKVSQGEVVKFAGDACRQMGEDGSVVLVEGREETVDFIPTGHRFCLTMSDPSLIGKRRAAQRILAQTLKDCGDAAPADEEGVAAAIKECCAKLA
ncbi:unnamed protein product [Amoebophrya sp. A25]|nr:unnamed protein product [Amoebophrya sp. A25]|eukprot:GSA25T00008650001.1